MKKRYRFIILIIVLGVCFLFLRPSIQWHFFTSRDQKSLAQGTRSYIKEYSEEKAYADLELLFEAARNNDPVPEDLEFLIPIARKNVRDSKQPLPDTWTAKNVLESFFSRREITEILENRYRDQIFALKKLQGNAVKLGLDLSGGLSIVLQANLSSEQERLGRPPNEAERIDAINRALESLNSRIDRFGLTEPVIRRQGTDQIYVEIPGTADPERINDIIMGKGTLSFHIVDDSDAIDRFYEHYLHNERNRITTFNANGELIDQTIIPSHLKILGVYEKDRFGLDEQSVGPDGRTKSFIAVEREVGLDGNFIREAYVERNNIDGRPEIIFRLGEYLDIDGGDVFYRLTSANVGKNLAIVMDDKVRSYPRISTGIRERGTITGFDSDSAENLALVLRTAALPVELEVASQQSIGASMGEDTIRQGLYALLGGIAAVLLFMLVFYKAAGINAIVAQLLNFYIMFSVLSALSFTLTLPAIAGFILTIGMATDANVIIFERIKEEMRLGKSRKAVIEAGFSKAFWAIMDSNITTFIAALFLSQLGSGPIRGFAVSLSIGVFSSVFTALFVSRLIFDFGTDVFRSKGLSVSWTTKIQDSSGSGNVRARAVTL